MLQEIHQMYREFFRESNWLVRLQLLYLLLVPAVLVGAAFFLIWLSFNG